MAQTVAPSFGLGVLERDVRDDPEAESRYLFEIPVLLLGAEEIARHRITEEALRQRLARAIRPTR